MADTIHIKDELEQFAGKVPAAVAEPVAFELDAVAGAMVGIKRAAYFHEQIVKAAQQLVTSAGKGMAAYRDGARTIEANYTSADTANADEFNALSTQVFAPLQANRLMPGATQGIAPDMPLLPDDLATNKDPGLPRPIPTPN